jgi:hypothetical protein
MANYNINAVTSAPSAAQIIATNKVRIASTVDVYVASGNSSVTATTSSTVVLAGSPERSYFIGAGNYVSVRTVTANGVCSITELGTTGVL